MSESGRGFGEEQNSRDKPEDTRREFTKSHAFHAGKSPARKGTVWQTIITIGAVPQHNMTRGAPWGHGGPKWVSFLNDPRASQAVGCPMVCTI